MRPPSDVVTAGGKQRAARHAILVSVLMFSYCSDGSVA